MKINSFQMKSFSSKDSITVRIFKNVFIFNGLYNFSTWLNHCGPLESMTHRIIDYESPLKKIRLNYITLNPEGLSILY